ncbi:MAG: flagellar protein FlgN [Calditrichaeota bacterium]|nr:flagellar protein FlgN [Calditrichota bacterium]
MKTKTTPIRSGDRDTLFYRELLHILRKENALLKELLNNYEIQREALIKNDLQVFIKNLEEQQILVWEADSTEKKRKDLLIRHFPEREADEMVLTELLHDAPGELQEDLQQQRESIRLLISKVNLYRETNRRLIQKSLEMLNYRIRLLTQWSERFYTQDGNHENSLPKLVNKKA